MPSTALIVIRAIEFPSGDWPSEVLQLLQRDLRRLANLTALLCRGVARIVAGGNRAGRTLRGLWIVRNGLQRLAAALVVQQYTTKQSFLEHTCAFLGAAVPFHCLGICSTLLRARGYSLVNRIAPGFGREIK